MEFTEEAVERAIDEAFGPSDLSSGVEAAFEDMQESMASAWVGRCVERGAVWRLQSQHLPRTHPQWAVG